ncbi:MAG: hypothetical protein WA110_07710 [Anaerolineaceae bacterium]
MNKRTGLGVLLAVTLLFASSTPAIANVNQSKVPDEIDVVGRIEAISGQPATYIEKEKLPYYSPDNVLSKYITGDFSYLVDDVTRQIIEIMPVNDQTVEYSTEALYTEDELYQMAVEFIQQVSPELVLDELTLKPGNKENINYFFRWIDERVKTPDGGPGYIQVGISRGGSILNLVNTIPFGGKNTVNQFNEIYANDGNYWYNETHNLISVPSYGYCGSPSGSWCSPYTIRYTTTTTGQATASAYWGPNSNTNTKASAFIPSNHATTTGACYYINGSSSASQCVNQLSYYDTWVVITPNPYTSGISTIRLNNHVASGSGSKVAWDEVWVYTY